MPPEEPHARLIAGYLARAERQRSLREHAETLARRVGYTRLAAFLVGSSAIALLLALAVRPSLIWAVTIAASLLFALLVRRHRRLLAAVRRHLALERAYETGPRRVRREWSALPAAPPLSFTSDHSYAGDLSLGGDHSLSRLLGPASAGLGAPVVREWLLAESPSPTPIIRARQLAIAELSPMADWREELGVLGQESRIDGDALSRFLDWAESDDRFVTGAWLAVARALAPLTVAALAGAAIGDLSGRIPLALVVINGVLYMAARAKLLAVARSASIYGFNLSGLAAMLRHVSARTFEADQLKGMRARVEGAAAAGAIDRLAQIATCAEARFSPMGHAALQALLLWDFHVVNALEGWRAVHGRAMRARLQALGELEALSALATVAHDNPAWNYPEFVEAGPPTVEATALGHPLLPLETRVANDVTVGPPGTFVLITGSNMAGKSTMLRTIGLNLILAQLGLPVCAERLSLPRVRVRTSIHVQDALEQGISLYMAELVRVKAIVDAAESATEPVVVYLLDEVLHGTNSADRRAAVAAVVGHLLRAGAIGAVSTHDLELLSAGDLAERAYPVHFSEQYAATSEGPRMSFDYRLRPGLAPTRNALALLEMMGLAPR